MQVHKGDVVRYHPVIGLPRYILVRVLEEPWELGDGSLITKARGIHDDKIYRPSVEALSEADSSSPAEET